MEYFIDCVAGSTYTIRYGLLSFRVYVKDGGYVSVPRQIWLDPEMHRNLIRMVKDDFIMREKSRSITSGNVFAQDSIAEIS